VASYQENLELARKKAKIQGNRTKIVLARKKTDGEMFFF
jgi:hypothetical protein